MDNHCTKNKTFILILKIFRFPGDNEIDQLAKIQKLIGPLTNDQQKSALTNRRFKNLKIENKNIDSLDKRFLGKVSKKELGFMKAILKMDPKERLSCKEALFHGYFDDIREDDIVPDIKTNQFIHSKADSKVALGNIKEERSNLEFDYLIHINL